jgi:hypothetical protein
MSTAAYFVRGSTGRFMAGACQSWTTVDDCGRKGWLEAQIGAMTSGSLPQRLRCCYVDQARAVGRLGRHP